VGHAQLLYRVAEDLGKPREQMIQDLLDGKTKFHNVFHYPTRSWADIGVIAWLVDAAAIVAQQALRDSSYAPYARTMRKICWEESVHIMHGRDVVVTMVNGTAQQRDMIQEALDRWWGPLMQMHGPRTPRERDRDIYWRVKAKTSRAAPGVPDDPCRASSSWLTIPDPELRYSAPDRDASWHYTEPDWDELRTVVTNHGPKSQERLDFRRLNWAATAWSARRSSRRPSRPPEPAPGCRRRRAQRIRRLTNTGSSPGRCSGANGRATRWSRRLRSGTRRRAGLGTTHARCTADGRRRAAVDRPAGRHRRCSTTPTSSNRRSIARTRSPVAT
jgi:ring-1,2-phenylacetyl-CoA epoxidase subunit PaaA